MNDHNPNHCKDCGEELFELKGEFHCPSCDSVSGFELVPDRESFTL